MAFLPGRTAYTLPRPAGRGLRARSPARQRRRRLKRSQSGSGGGGGEDGLRGPSAVARRTGNSYSIERPRNLRGPASSRSNTLTRQDGSPDGPPPRRISPGTTGSSRRGTAKDVRSE